MKGKKYTKEQVAFGKMLENRQWLADNFNDIFGKYPDEWIAVVDKQVKARGMDVDQVKQEIGDKLEEAALLRVPKQPPVRSI